MALELTCTNEQKIKIVANPATSTGRPVALDGPLSVTIVSGNALYTVVDALSFYVVSSDEPGDTTFLVEADADLGAGVVPIQDTITLHVQGALAENLGLTVSPAEPK